MKKLYILPLIILLVSILLVSCATGGGTLTTFDKSFRSENAKISLLPPRFDFDATGSIESGSEQKIGQMIYNTLVKRTSSEWVSPDKSVSLIQEANVLNEYESFLDGYKKTGIPSKSRLEVLSETVKTPYIALSQIEHKVTGNIGMSNYRITNVTILVLSATKGKVVLEVVGNAQCGSGTYDIGAVALMQKSIDEAISKFPGAKPASD